MGGRHIGKRPKQEDAPPAKPGDDQLVELHRVAIRDFEARGFLPSYIATKLRIPYRVVEAALSTPAKPKKPR